MMSLAFKFMSYSHKEYKKLYYNLKDAKRSLDNKK